MMEKKSIAFITCIVLCFFSSTAIYADESAENKDRDSILTIIANQNEINDEDYLYDTEAYDESLSGQDFKNDVAIRIYHQYFWNLGNKSIAELQSIANSADSWQYSYIVFRDKPILVSKYKRGDGTYKVFCEPFETVPTYIQDIIDSDIYNSELNSNDNTYNKILCLNDDNSHKGIAVYYFGDKSNIVRYYESSYSDSVDFSLSDFQKYSVGYYEYATAYENNYDKNGSPLYGPKLTFLEYVSKEKESTSHSNSAPEESENNLVQVIIISVSAVFIFGCIGIVVYKLAKNQKNQA